MSLPNFKHQPVHISLRQYVENPYKGSAFLASRKMIRDGLNITFIKLLKNYRKQFFVVPYIDEVTKDIMFHVRVPSEAYENNKMVYDVLIKLKYDANKRFALRDALFFSNSPSFLYTYAYVYYHDQIMINEFAEKMPMKALTDRPEVRNPVESLGYEKSTYIAARYLLDGGVLTDTFIQKFGRTLDSFTINMLQIIIPDPEDVVDVYAYNKHLMVKKHRKIANAEKQAKRVIKADLYRINQKHVISGIKAGKIIKPRAKITARKAKRLLLNKSN